MSTLLTKSITLARKLTFHSDKFRVAAFLYSGKKLLSVGQNSMNKTHTKVKRFGQRFNVDHFIEFNFCHAEIDAISRIWGKYYISKREKLVVVRLNKSGLPCLAKPCQNCQTVIDALGITKVEWTE